jgi:YHS domain-containing protein
VTFEGVELAPICGISKLKGVYYKPGVDARVWITWVRVDGELISLGAYLSREAAGCAYNRYLIEEQGLPPSDFRVNQELLAEPHLDLYENSDRMTGLLRQVVKFEPDFLQPLPKKKRKGGKRGPHKTRKRELVITKEQLEKDRERYTLTELVEKHKVSLDFLKRHFRECGLATPDVKVVNWHRLGINKDTLYQALVIDYLTYTEAANRFNCSAPTVRNAKIYFEIDLDDRKKYHSKECPHCETTFFPRFDHQIACSEECRDNFRQKQYKARDRQQTRLKERKCKYCKSKHTLETGYSKQYCTLQCEILYDIEVLDKQRTDYYSRVYFYTCTATGDLFTSKKKILGEPFKSSEIKKQYQLGMAVVSCHRCSEEVKRLEAVQREGSRWLFCSEHCYEEFLVESREHRLARMREWATNNRDRLKLSEALYRDKQRKRNKVKYGTSTSPKDLERSKVRKKTPSSKEIQARLSLFGDNVCCYCLKTCDSKNPHDCTTEHLVPISKGGDNSLTNLFRACGNCNYKKMDTDWREWFRQQEFYSKEQEDLIDYYSKNVG